MKKQIHMKNIARITAILAVLVSAASCQQFKIDTQMTAEQQAKNAKMLCNALESYSVSAANPQQITFSVTSNTPWSIVCTEEWLTVSPSNSGAAGLIADVTVTVQPNTGGQDRSATLTLRSDEYDLPSIMTQISQKRKGSLFIVPSAEDFNACGGELTFTVESNLPWEIRADQGWLSFDKKSGEGTGQTETITMIAAASKVMQRSVNVTITAGDEQETFEVLQEATFSVTPLSVEFPSSQATQVIRLKTDLPWEISCDQSWISFDKYEGNGDGNTVEIVATAAVNPGPVRSAAILVKAGDSQKEIEVSQNGVSFNIVVPEDPTISRKGGDIVVEVNTTIDWSVECDNVAFTAVKTDDTHFTVSAAWNNSFAPRKTKATIKSPTGITDSIELTQDVNFEFSGHCEVLEDGSVKLYGDEASRVSFKDSYRMVDVVLTMGEKNFGAKARFWFTGALGGCNIYNQLTLGGNTRIRTDGTMANGASAYKNNAYSITRDQLNAMSTYEFKINPNADDASNLDSYFGIDGSKVGGGVHPNAFYHDHDNDVNWYFGMYDASLDGTWYIIKTCDITVVEESYL